jgi:CheY-like chemotaxis protein
MDLTTVFAKTRDGIEAQFDPRNRMSPAFKRLLTAIDGKQSLEQLLVTFPHLGAGDIRMWASELARMRYVEPVAQFDTTAPKTSYVYDGYIEMTADPAFKAAASEVGKWMKENMKAEEKTPEADLVKTSQMAIIEADSTISTIARSGFFMQPAAAPAATEKRRVLIVEDDEMQLALLKKIVEKEGHTIEVAHNRAEVLAALNHLPYPDLLLLDVQLPDVDGFRILEKVKTHPRLKESRVVMVTGRTERADIAKGVLLGADGYITKPYRPATMTAAIRQALGQG